MIFGLKVHKIVSSGSPAIIFFERLLTQLRLVDYLLIENSGS